jgi:hypothetical protein
MLGKELMVPGNEAAWNKFLGDNNLPVLIIRLVIFNDIIITKWSNAIVLRSLSHNAEKGCITLLASMKIGNGDRINILHAVLNRIEDKIRFVKTVLGLLH